MATPFDIQVSVDDPADQVKLVPSQADRTRIGTITLRTIVQAPNSAAAPALARAFWAGRHGVNGAMTTLLVYDVIARMVVVGTLPHAAAVRGV